MHLWKVNKYHSTKGRLTLLLGAHEKFARTSASSIKKKKKKSQNSTCLWESPPANKAKMPIWFITKRQLGSFWLEISRTSRTKRFATTVERLMKKKRPTLKSETFALPEWDFWNAKQMPGISSILLIPCNTIQKHTYKLNFISLRAPYLSFWIIYIPFQLLFSPNK